VTSEGARHSASDRTPVRDGPPPERKGGRADVRLSIDAGGELYLYSKGDGIIRAVVEAIGF